MMSLVVGLRRGGFLVLTLLATTSSAVAQQAPKTNSVQDSTPTFRSVTRLVTIEVVAKDRHGHHVEGLKPEDFELFEQSADGKDKRAQKIASFQEVHFADLAKQAPPPMKVPAGVYTNAVTLQKNPVPPTIILVDALNTRLGLVQLQVQMDRILKAIPKNTPVAIFLLGMRGLRILQDFSTDPEDLKAALKRLGQRNPGGSAFARSGQDDTMDNPNYASSQLDSLRGQGSDTSGAAAVIDAQVHELAKIADRMVLEEIKLATDDSVRRTLQAFIDLGHYVAGYPGRKNLFWVSNAFPIKLNGLLLQVDLTGGYDEIGFAMGSGYADYQAQIRNATGVLSDAKLAIYPVNPGGVQPHGVYRADARPGDTSGPGMTDAMSHETVRLADQDKTMRVVAEDTGGAVCNGSNDLGECFTRAFDDGSSFYEIAYYPDSEDWNGGYRRVILQTKKSGMQLEYRHGYYAGQAPGESPKAELQRAACTGYLGSSSVVFAATKLPADATGQLRFYVDIDPQTLTLSPTDDGGRNFSIEVAACSFDKEGKPLQLISQSISGKLNAKEYQTVAQNGLTHVMAIPAPLPTGVRLVVRDVPTDRIGTVHVNLENPAAIRTTAREAKSQ